jgi:hypothetical protein
MQEIGRRRDSDLLGVGESIFTPEAGHPGEKANPLSGTHVARHAADGRVRGEMTTA